MKSRITLEQVFALLLDVSGRVDLLIVPTATLDASQPEQFRVTETEGKVLDLLVQGKGNREIAAGIGNQARTVKAHIAHLLHKLHIPPDHPHPRIVLARYWSCPLFRIGAGYESPHTSSSADVIRRDARRAKSA